MYRSKTISLKFKEKYYLNAWINIKKKKTNRKMNEQPLLKRQETDTKTKKKKFAIQIQTHKDYYIRKRSK